MSKDRIKLSLGSALILLALLLLLLQDRPHPPFEPAVHQAIGKALADEALKLAAGGGSITIIARDTRSAANPAADTQLKAFCQAVGKSAKISSTNWVKVDPLRIPEVPPGDFWIAIKNAGENDVVVSFMGPPTFDEAQHAKLGSKSAKVVALATGPVARRFDLPSLFKRGLLQAAITDREDPAKPSTPSASSNPQALFDSLYTLISSTGTAPKP